MRIRRGGLAEPRPTARTPPKPRSASSASSQTVTSRPAAAPTSAACSASQAGVLRLAGTVARVRDRHPAPPSASARTRSSSAPSSVMPARTTLATGCSCGPVERQWKAYEPSIAPTTQAARPSPATAASVVTTLVRSLVARAIAAAARRTSVTVASPTPTRRTTVTSSPATGTVVTSPVRPVARLASSEASRSVPSSSEASSAPGPSSGPSGPVRTGKAHTSAPPIWCGSAGLRANSGGETCVGSCAVVATISRRRP